jgi:two-component system sensor histidine kinase CpxA
MVLIIASAIGVTATIAWSRMGAINAAPPARLVGEAAGVLHDRGEAGLGRWLEAAVAAHPELDLYVVDGQGADLLHRRVPERIEQWLALNGAPLATGAAARAYAPYGYDFAPHGVAPRAVALNRSHLLANPTLQAPDGATYRMVIAWFGATPIDALGSGSTVLVLLLIAVAVSAVVCWWIARSISRPVAKLQLGARALALGNLDTQVDQAVCARRDELGRLARDFNEMAERLRSQISSKETLIRDISHELRSPLARLRVTLALAQQGEGDLGVQLERIERDIERLDLLIGDTLQFSRLSSAMPVIERDRVELAPFMEDVVADAQLDGAPEGKRISLHAPSGVWVAVDPGLFRRALDNVLRNAVRYTSPGSTVEVSVRRRGGTVSISICDHGPGVPEPQLQRIFEAFYRVKEARDRSSGGAGLGLAITARVMALHEGKVEASNGPKGGLLMVLSLPVDRMVDDAASNSESPSTTLV